jgi:hypothetical protein
MINFLQYLGVGAGAAAVLGLVLVFFLRGVWAKFGTAMMKAEIALWWSHREQRDALKLDVKEIIDNEVQRADGLIRRVVTKETNDVVGRMEVELQSVAAKMDRMSDILHDVVERLARVEGTVDILAKRSGLSRELPAQLPPALPADATGRLRPPSRG